MTHAPQQACKTSCSVDPKSGQRTDVREQVLDSRLAVLTQCKRDTCWRICWKQCICPQYQLGVSFAESIAMWTKVSYAQQHGEALTVGWLGGVPGSSPVDMDEM